MADFAVLACDKTALSKDRMKSYCDKLAKSPPVYTPSSVITVVDPMK